MEVEGLELVGEVAQGGDAVHAGLGGVAQGGAEGVGAAALEELVGVLAAVAVGDDAAALGAQAAEQLGAQAQAGGVGVDGDEDGALVVEV